MAKNKFIHNPFKDRKPVLRFRAGQNIIITLLSFAFSVSATRLFLELTGYPQLGGGNLHIAHVLWGGLFLFVATLIPIIFINEWALTLSALVSGLGVGLFIDEVGKFITSNNDYFYPSAAPIVYVFFLLTVLVSFRVRTGRHKTSRAKMYEILERFSEVLDRDLSTYEREKLLQSLAEVKSEGQNQELRKLADALQNYLQVDQKTVEAYRPNFLDRLRIGLIRFERRVLTRKRVKFVIILSLLGWGIWALFSPIVFYSISNNPVEYQTFLQQMIANRLVSSASGLTWFEAKVLLEGGFGFAACLSAFLMLMKAEKPATWVGMISLLISITVVNLLVFYFDQFSTIIIASIQFLLLMLILRYRQRFLEPVKEKNP